MAGVLPNAPAALCGLRPSIYQQKLFRVDDCLQVPNENPKDVVARIDAELAEDDSNTAAGDKDAKEVTNRHGSPKNSTEWDFSGWPMLLLLMPPVGFVTVAQPIMNTCVMHTTTAAE